jgi:putative chitinase
MLLKVGSSGEDVKKLQAKLGLSADGSFGPATAEAVKKWQTANGLGADGIVGDGTWGKLFPGEGSAPVVSSSFKLEALKGHIPDAVIAQIPDTAAKFGITNTLRLAHFLAQCGHESGGFKAVSENLNYSAKGLVGTFKKYFPTEVVAKPYERNPEKIASKVYGSRMGNGDEQSGEGYKFRGRGYLQTTGKENYRLLGQFLNVDLISNPDLVSTKYPLASAAFFFNSNGLWSICDKGISEDVIKALTKRINGGYHGLEDRINQFVKFFNILK